MTSRDFVYWIAGFFEIAKPTEMTAEQTEMVKRRLALVFIHELDPSAPAHQQASLNAAHAPATGAHPNPFPTTSVSDGVNPAGATFRC